MVALFVRMVAAFGILILATIVEARGRTNLRAHPATKLAAIVSAEASKRRIGNIRVSQAEVESAEEDVGATPDVNSAGDSIEEQTTRPPQKQVSSHPNLRAHQAAKLAVAALGEAQKRRIGNIHVSQAEVESAEQDIDANPDVDSDGDSIEEQTTRPPQKQVSNHPNLRAHQASKPAVAALGEAQKRRIGNIHQSKAKVETAEQDDEASEEVNADDDALEEQATRHPQIQVASANKTEHADHVESDNDNATTSVGDLDVSQDDIDRAEKDATKGPAAESGDGNAVAAVGDVDVSQSDIDAAEKEATQGDIGAKDEQDGDDGGDATQTTDSGDSQGEDGVADESQHERAISGSERSSGSRPKTKADAKISSIAGASEEQKVGAGNAINVSHLLTAKTAKPTPVVAQDAKNISVSVAPPPAKQARQAEPPAAANPAAPAQKHAVSVAPPAKKTRLAEAPAAEAAAPSQKHAVSVAPPAKKTRLAEAPAAEAAAPSQADWRHTLVQSARIAATELSHRLGAVGTAEESVDDRLSSAEDLDEMEIMQAQITPEDVQAAERDAQRAEQQAVPY